MMTTMMMKTYRKRFAGPMRLYSPESNSYWYVSLLIDGRVRVRALTAA